MRAHVGDRIAVASRTIGGVVRDGEIAEVRSADGSPPYLVRWSDTGHLGLLFPGMDAHLSGVPEPESIEPAQTGESAQSTEPVPLPHVRSWRVDIDLFEIGDNTTAHAVLLSEAPGHLDARGEAHREPTDVEVPEIGDEVAVARALRRLSDRLLETVSSDLAGIEEHHPAVTE